MRKYIITIIAFLIVFLIISGCSIFKQNEDVNKDGNQENNSRFQGNRGGINFLNDERFTEGISDDLKIGKIILVIGSTNPDGSVVADRIIIGDNKDDFQNIFMNTRPEQKDGGEKVGVVNPENMLTPPDNGERPNFGQFQNLSDEERTKIREEMMANGKVGRMGGGLRNAGQGVAGMMGSRLTGEVIDKGDVNITLKLETGGSKLVFFSESTAIMLFSDNK